MLFRSVADQDVEPFRKGGKARVLLHNLAPDKPRPPSAHRLPLPVQQVGLVVQGGGAGDTVERKGAGERLQRERGDGVPGGYAAEVDYDTIRAGVMEEIIKPALPAAMLDKDTKYFINPTGRFVIGGPVGDCGLTGRKIIVDMNWAYGKNHTGINLDIGKLSQQNKQILNNEHRNQNTRLHRF